MAQYMNSKSENLKHNNSSNQRSLILENIKSSVDCKSVDIKRLLKILNTTQNVDLQLKLFCILTICMINDESYKEPIILNNQIYRKVQLMLTKSQPRKLIVLLKFLTILIYSENTDTLKRKTLTIHAQNMIRTSECLLRMANIFVTDMVFNEIWIGLCQCLAETCRDSEENQNYCSYLIPMCISKCAHSGPEVLSFMDSLLQNNERNIKLFLNCDGLSIFTEETLIDINYMQLLNTLTKSSTSANIIVEKTNFINILREMLDLYGTTSQIGQWAVVILHHVSPYLKGLDEKQDAIQRVTSFHFENSTKNILEDNNFPEDTTTIFANLLREVVQLNSKQPQSDLKDFSKVINCLKNQKVIPSQYNVKGKQSQLQTFCESEKKSHIQKSKSITYSQELFPFNISNETSKQTTKWDESIAVKNPFKNPSNKELDKTNIFVHSLDFSRRIINRLNESVDDNTINFENIQPISSSTPKCSNAFKISNQSRRSDNLTDTRPRAIRKLLNVTNNKPVQMKRVTRKSMSSRLISAINDSCANIFNIVKNLFKPKTNTSDSKATNTTCNDVYSDCSYSFTNYMRKRDKLCRRKLSTTGEPTTNNFNYRNVTCKTCNDTMLLRYKFADDEDLKQTVKKLKIGINVYGCDFKKISKAFWAKNERMKPAVLYHIYRKLLLK